MDLRISRDDLDDLVEGYFAHYRRLSSSNRADRLAAHEGDPLGDWLLDWLISPGVVPEVAWDVVITLLDRAPDEDALAFVIAGPLEDLVRHHGYQFAERLVERSRTDAKFRRAMTTVYALDGVPPALQDRLGAVIQSDERVRRPRRRRG